MTLIGGNNPPTNIALAMESATALNNWLAENPVIQTIEQAKEGKLLTDRVNGSLQEVEAERDSLVRPLNTKVAEINQRYKTARTPIETLRNELVRRLTNYSLTVEQERIRVAEEKRRLLEEAEKAARQAEQAEQDIRESADTGELGGDLIRATEDADQAFDAYQKASREAARADKDTKVKITGGFSRAMGLKDKETLVVEDAELAVSFIELTDGLQAEIIKAARQYRKTHDGELPPGVVSTYRREL